MEYRNRKILEKMGVVLRVVILFILSNFFSNRIQSQTLIEGLPIEILDEYLDSIDVYMGNDKFKNYIVHVIKIHSAEDSSYCASISYIVNSSEYRIVQHSHTIRYRGHYFLVELEDIKDAYLVDRCGAKFFNMDTTISIVQKLVPSEVGVWSYMAQGLIYCKSNKDEYKKFYKDTDEMPSGASIYEGIYNR